MNDSIKLQIVYQFFYRLIHLLVSLLQIISNLLKLYITRNDGKIILNNNYFNKIPKHIAIGINEELIYYEDLVQIIKWCQQLNITYVSIFKNNGLIVSHKEFEKYLNKSTNNGKKSLIGSKAHKNGFNKTQTNAESKPFLTLDNINVRFLSSQDSHQSIVKAAKHFCSQEEAIDQQDISLYLRKDFDFADPELLICFGSSPILNGYPLWQIRLTEIYFLPTHQNITINQFYQIINSYSRCEQRFGK